MQPNLLVQKHVGKHNMFCHKQLSHNVTSSISNADLHILSTSTVGKEEAKEPDPPPQDLLQLITSKWDTHSHSRKELKKRNTNFIHGEQNPECLLSEPVRLLPNLFFFT